MKSHFLSHSTYLKKEEYELFLDFFCMKFNCNSDGNNYCGNTVVFLEALKVYIITTFITFQHFDVIEMYCKMQRLD